MTDIYGGGATGASAYELYVEVQTEAGAPVLSKSAWIASLKGDVGVVIDPEAVAWDVEADYATRAVTTDAGSTWIAKRPTTGERPSLTPDAWAVLVPGVDLAFAAALEDSLQGVIDEADVAMTQQVQTAGASASAAAGSAVTAQAAETGAEAAQAAAELAAGNAQAAALTCATWATLAALTGTLAGQGAEVLDSDAGTHTDPVVGGTVNNGGRYSWSASPAGWRRIGDTGLTSKAAAADLAAEAAARAALVTGDDTDLGHVIRNLLGFWLANFTEAGDILSKYLSISATGDQMEFRDALGFHIATIGSDGVTIKGCVTMDARPGGDWIVADPLGFHLIAMIGNRFYVMGEEVGSGSTAALIEAAPEVELARTGILKRGPTGLPNWRKARAAVLQRIGGARILCLGDSLTAGGSTEAGSLQAAAYPTMLARLLGNVYPATAAGFYGGKYGSGISAYDPRLTLGAGWTAVEASTVAVLGGQAIENTTTTNALTFAPGVAWDTAEVTVAGIGAGSLGLSIGGAVTNYSPTVGVVTTITYTAASLAAHTLTIARVSGDVQVLGIVCTDSTAPAVTVINAARGGYEIGDYLDSTDFYSPANTLPNVTADLCLVEIGINDRNAELAPASYRAQLSALLDLLPAASDVVLIASASPSPGALTYAWSEYVEQMRLEADSRGLDLIDLTVAMGDRTTIEAQGWNSDGVHLTRRGLAEKAHIIHKILTA